MLTTTLILVEGVSDLAFLSLLFGKWFGLKYIKEDPEISFSVPMEHCFYKNDKNLVCIVSVGGCDKFNSFYDEAVGKSVLYSQLANVRNLVLIVDSDKRTPAQIVSSISFGDISFTANSIFTNSICDDYGENKILDSYLCVIPKGREGALETVILDGLRTEYPSVIDDSIAFVDGLSRDSKKCLDKTRLVLKAKTGVAFSLIQPDKTFHSLSEKFKLVNPYDRNVILNFKFFECFFGKIKGIPTGKKRH